MSIQSKGAKPHVYDNYELFIVNKAGSVPEVRGKNVTNKFRLHDVTNVYDTTMLYTGTPAIHGITFSHAFGNTLSR